MQMSEETAKVTADFPYVRNEPHRVNGHLSLSLNPHSSIAVSVQVPVLPWSYKDFCFRIIQTVSAGIEVSVRFK